MRSTYPIFVDHHPLPDWLMSLWHGFTYPIHSPSQSMMAVLDFDQRQVEFNQYSHILFFSQLSRRVLFSLNNAHIFLVNESVIDEDYKIKYEMWILGLQVSNMLLVGWTCFLCGLLSRPLSLWALPLTWSFKLNPSSKPTSPIAISVIGCLASSWVGGL